MAQRSVLSSTSATLARSLAADTPLAVALRTPFSAKSLGSSSPSPAASRFSSFNRALVVSLRSRRRGRSVPLNSSSGATLIVSGSASMFHNTGRAESGSTSAAPRVSIPPLSHNTQLTLNSNNKRW
ncbi:hypothetical protein LX36DRAFT_656736 [Colletotrichum falcatum]|nr:hypothetical protein LX36DRAFT_656736 [Colletotrichum falcatum]